jgi:hypothetical protein
VTSYAPDGVQAHQRSIQVVVAAMVWLSAKVDDSLTRTLTTRCAWRYPSTNFSGVSSTDYSHCGYTGKGLIVCWTVWNSTSIADDRYIFV